MKKINILLVLLVVVNMSVTAQTFQERFHVSAYGGGGMEQKNTNINFGYSGLIMRYFVTQGANWMFGPFLKGGISWSANNATLYKGNSLGIGGGLSVGYYRSDSLSARKAYHSLDVGIMSGVDEGEIVRRSGRYEGTQRDVMLDVALNFNFMKKQLLGWFPRTQLTFESAHRLSTRKDATWNGEPLLDSPPYNATRAKLRVKQSIIGWQLNSLISTSQKLILSYEYSGEKTYVSGGGEIAFGGFGKEEFLHFNLVYRLDLQEKQNQVVFGVVFNVTQLVF